MDLSSRESAAADLVRVARRATRRCESVRTAITDVARDTTYVGIGLTILGVQRAQVLRRELLDR